MALYTVGFAACLLIGPPATYADWKAIFSGSFVRLATMFFVAALLYHAWVGVRNILMDYAKPTSVRLTLQVIVICVLIAYVAWTVQVLWGA